MTIWGCHRFSCWARGWLSWVPGLRAALCPSIPTATNMLQPRNQLVAWLFIFFPFPFSFLSSLLSQAWIPPNIKEWDHLWFPNTWGAELLASRSRAQQPYGLSPVQCFFISLIFLVLGGFYLVFQNWCCLLLLCIWNRAEVYFEAWTYCANLTEGFLWK